MKIISQTGDEMMLKEGDGKGIIAGVVLVVVGIGIAFYAHFIPSTLLWIGIAVFIVGLSMVFLAASIDVDINKGTGQIVYQTKRLIGGNFATYAVAGMCSGSKRGKPGGRRMRAREGECPCRGKLLCFNRLW